MDNISVFLSSDDKYSPYVATTIASILKNTKSFIDFYILDGGISDINKQKIINTKKYFKNFSIEFININIEKEFEYLPELPYISKAMYSRFLIPLLKPNLKKIIYSDIDVAFVKDIKELYDINLDGYIIGAVTSYRNKECKQHYIETKKRLNIKKEHSIFCSGLLLIDVLAWNANSITQKLFDIAKELSNKNKLVLPDQDTLNKCFECNYYKLDKKFCIIPKSLKQNFTGTEIKKIIKEQVCCHYAGGGIYKPWNNKKLNGAKYFWQYVKYTDFAKEINENYRKFNHINSFIENIFSIKNEYKNDIKRKVICILGIKIKFIIKKKEK